MNPSDEKTEEGDSDSEEESNQPVPEHLKLDFFKEAERQRAILAAMPIMTEEEWEAQMIRNGYKRFYPDYEKEEKDDSASE